MTEMTISPAAADSRIDTDESIAKKSKKNYFFRSVVCFLSRMNFRRKQECKMILNWLDSKPGEYILDVGSGDGYYDSLIAKKGAHVVGIDIHEKRMSVAKARYENEMCTFRIMNAEEMDFPAESFDQVMSLCVIEHLHDENRVIENIARVLKPGGRLVFSADSLSHPMITDQERVYHKKRYAVNTFYTVEVIKEKLERAGLKLEKTQYIMNTAFDIALTRLSWKIDDWPQGFGIARMLGYILLGVAWNIGALLKGRSIGTQEGGLTLLIIASKPGPSNRE